MSYNMQRILSLTVFGLNPKFYFKYAIFGALFATLIWLTTDYANVRAIEQGKSGLSNFYLWFNRIFLILCTLSYPYARYLYAKFWEFFFDNSEWYLGGILLLIVYYFKFIMRAFLFVFAIFITPIAWVVLYFENRKFY